jgi:rSAM/selenodomain-associated transferase 2
MRTYQERNLVSVVIPTLNAEAGLDKALQAIGKSRLVSEVIIADGGSTGATAAIAAQWSARFVAAPRGRGSQLAAGAAEARCRWLLFLHADCRLAPEWEDAVDDFLAAPDGERRAGYFVYALDDEAPAARRLERIVAWRCRALALPYGDQGLLIAKSLYDEVGGFAEIPLMEDVDLVRRLGRRRLAPIAARCVSSARRYTRGGYVLRPLRNLICLSLFFAGVPPRRIVRLYG